MGGCRVLVLLGLGVLSVSIVLVGEPEPESEIVRVKVRLKVKVQKQESSMSQVAWTERRSLVRLALNPDPTQDPTQDPHPHVPCPPPLYLPPSQNLSTRFLRLSSPHPAFVRCSSSPLRYREWQSDLTP